MVRNNLTFRSFDFEGEKGLTLVETGFGSDISFTTTTTRCPVLVDLVMVSVVNNILVVVGAAAFVGLLAQIYINLGFTPVPITGQTFGVLLVGSALGWSRASLSMGLYLFAGTAGLPWFAGHSSGTPPTLGYITGFVLSGAILGWPRLTRQRPQRRTRGSLHVPWRGSDLHRRRAVVRSLASRLVQQRTEPRIHSVLVRRHDQGRAFGTGIAHVAAAN